MDSVVVMKLIAVLFCHALGDFKRRLPRTPSTGTMSSADDLDEREPPSPSDNGNVPTLRQVINVNEVTGRTDTIDIVINLCSF